MVRVAALYRLSTVKQSKRRADDEVDIPGQRLAVRKFIAGREGWNLLPDFEYEEVVSAFKKSAEERQVLQEVYRDAESGRWDVLVVFKHDRLSRRKVTEYLAALERFERAGVEVWSVADNRRLSTDDDEILLRFMEGYVANRSSKDTAQRVAARMAQRAELGKWNGGRPPFGYKQVPVLDSTGVMVLRGNRLVQEIVPSEEASIVREMYRRYLHGQTAINIATWLNSAGVPSWSGKVWARRQVAYVLENPVYCGLIRYQPKGQANPILVDGEHEAIIDRSVWEDAQRTKAARAQIPKRQQGMTYALTGVLFCGRCGGRIGGMTRRFKLKDGHRETYQYYRCRTRAEHGLCNVGQMSARVIEANFITALEECFTAPTGLRSFLEQQSQAAGEAMKADQIARRRMNDRVKEIETALKRLDRAYFEAGTVDDAEYAEKKSAYQEERRGLETELAKPAPTEEARDVGALVEQVKQLRELWYDEETTPEERKVIALSIVKSWRLKVLVHRDKRVEILAE